MTTTATTTNAKFVHAFNQKSQYSADVIKSFEVTFGAHYMSAGGLETTVETAQMLEPVLQKPGGARILEVGCGIGGASFFFAEHYGAHVHGVDANPIGIEIANETIKSKVFDKGSCRFETLDVATADFDESYDIIYSRDVLLHIDNETKKSLFRKFHQWLSPGGIMLITDYCLGPKSAKQISPEFQEYMDTRGYHLLTPNEYKALCVSAGFEADFCNAEDRQLWYCQVSQREVDRLVLPGPARDQFLAFKTEADIVKMQKVYQDKILMTLRGDRSYVVLKAQKTKSHFALRQQVVDAYKTLATKSYIMSCDGNISARASQKTFLITPSGVTIPNLTADKVVLCNTHDGRAMKEESYKPSSEYALHTEIYKARPDVGAIVHSHSIYVCALACCRVPLPPAHYAVCELLQDFDFSASTGGSTSKPAVSVEDATIQCAPYHTYGTQALSQATVKALGKNHAVLMANHGAVVVGEDLETAMYKTERLERECEIYWRSLQMNSVAPPKPLTLEEIRDLQAADSTYGQDHPLSEEDSEKDEDTPSMTTSSSESELSSDGDEEASSSL